MKTTIDLPDALYRRVKARAAIERRAVRDITIDLFRRWLGEEARADGPEHAGEWLESWLERADEAVASAPPGATARDQLSRDRSRLDR
ncbi:MAG: hypothetical protein HS107_07380 [Thermoflexaceae bacterium]|nr:hypothetical protein [Thermoflexaceae bacterium]